MSDALSSSTLFCLFEHQLVAREYKGILGFMGYFAGILTNDEWLNVL
jgi:hypothetical protein